MDHGQHAGFGIEQGDGDTVGDQDGQRRIEVGRDENVGRGDGILQPPGAPTALGGAHDGRPRTVHLIGEDQVVEFDAEGPGGPLPVHEHSFGVVADVEGQIQGPVGTFGHPPVSGRDRHGGAEGHRFGPVQEAHACIHLHRGVRLHRAHATQPTAPRNWELAGRTSGFDR